MYPGRQALVMTKKHFQSLLAAAGLQAQAFCKRLLALKLLELLNKLLNFYKTIQNMMRSKIEE